MDHVPSIAKLLGELSSISDRAQLRGLYCELLVLKHYLNLNYRLVEYRHKGVFAEIDLIMARGSTRVLIEVKSISNLDFWIFRLSGSQSRRLSREYLDQTYRFANVDIEFHYVVVSQSGEIQVFDEYFS